MEEAVDELIFKLSKNDLHTQFEKWRMKYLLHLQTKTNKDLTVPKTKCNNSYAHIFVSQRRNVSRVWLLFFSIFEEKDVSMNQYCSVSWHKASLNDFETNEPEFDFSYYKMLKS